MKKITVIGVGAGQLDQLPIGLYRKLQKAELIIARTDQHPVIHELRMEGLHIESFDGIYEQYDTFDQVYEEVTSRLLTLAVEKDVTYVVPGHPLVAEQTVQRLLQQQNVKIEILGGSSFLDAVFTALHLDPIEGFQLLDATNFQRDDVQMTQHVLIAQVYDAFVASEVKLTLMEKYEDDYPVTILTAVGTDQEQLQTIPLYELDRKMSTNNLTTIYVPPVKERKRRLKEWRSLREIIAALRAPNGCPWDRAQTHESLQRYLLEEAHELLQAIQTEDDEGIVEELGDVLLQVFLHAQIGEDNGYFSMEDVLERIAEKMVRRHPHVFGDVAVEHPGEVMTNWQAIKDQEQPKKSSLLTGEERFTSSLSTSYNYQKAAAKVGFSWPTIEGAFEKYEEEWNEFKEEVASGSKATQIDELGDVFFTLVNVARMLQICPEEAMVHANQKFKERFTYVEQCVRAGKGSFEAYTLTELDAFWHEAKRKEEMNETR